MDLWKEHFCPICFFFMCSTPCQSFLVGTRMGWLGTSSGLVLVVWICPKMLTDSARDLDYVWVFGGIIKTPLAATEVWSKLFNCYLFQMDGNHASWPPRHRTSMCPTRLPTNDISVQYEPLEAYLPWGWTTGPWCYGRIGSPLQTFFGDRNATCFLLSQDGAALPRH